MCLCACVYASCMLMYMSALAHEGMCGAQGQHQVSSSIALHHIFGGRYWTWTYSYRIDGLVNELPRSAIYTTTNPNDEFIGICCCIYLLYNFFLSARDLYTGLHVCGANSSLMKPFPSPVFVFSYKSMIN